MAQLHPRLDELHVLPAPLNEGERQMLEALARLDDDWLVFVQPCLGLDRPDFIVVHPEFGVTVVEVKDWSVGCYRQGADGYIEVRHGSGWRRTDEAPRHQVHRYRDMVFSRCFADGSTASADLSLVRGVVVLVRHTTVEARRLLARPQVSDAEEWVHVFGGSDLVDEPARVLTGSRSPRPRQVDPDRLLRLRRHLAESDLLAEQRLPMKLNPTAQNIERNPNNARIRRVRGAAGSGKSLGLAARAARLAKEGQDVLVVSFNSTLPHYLRELSDRRCLEIKGPNRRITTTHLHGLCSRVIDDARFVGYRPTSTSLPGTLPWWEEQVERAIDAYRGVGGPTFDAVLVDEGQDFSLIWWNFLREHVLRDGGEMLLVADPTQDLYDKQAWTDEEVMSGAGFSGPWTEARGSYRMPPDLIPVVAQFAERHVPGAQVSPVLPEDHPLQLGEHRRTFRRWVNLPRGRRLGFELGEQVIALLSEHPDLAESDVVFLAPTHDDGLDAVAVIEAAGHQVQHIFGRTPQEKRERKSRFWGRSPGVKGCTVHSFKGWEARAVVLSVDPGDDSHRLAYVGLTRVKGDLSYKSAFVTVVNRDLALDGFSSYFEAS